MTTPPDFTAGQVLTAAQMNAVGLWLIKTQTIGNAVDTVTVSNAFSADFDNYKIMISGGVGSTTLALHMTLGATTTGYYYGGKLRTYAGTDVNLSGSNAAFFYGGEGNAQTLSLNVEVINPFLADQTLFSVTTGIARTDGYGLLVGGYLDNSTSYTAFTLTASTGTVTGGTIRVYGYRN